MDTGLRGKVALVTAASKGLGRGCAAALAAEGVRVAICARHENEVRRTADELGGGVLPWVCDVTDTQQVGKLLGDVRSTLGEIDILVTNAGGPPAGTFATTPIEQYPKAIDLNLMSAVRLVHGVVGPMKEKHWGRIVMVTSISVKQPIGNLLLSNMARAGLTGFMKTIATELAPHGITVNALLPGLHETDRVKSLLASQTGDFEKNKAQMVAGVPMKRLGNAADFGAACAFLCSMQAGFITGQNLLIDGGAYAGLI
ncbi:MAG: SDR family oxidoreductase [Phycisphaera sp.]|nr:SDR family oxidoreductase [Phycisphaera sp.]